LEEKVGIVSAFYLGFARERVKIRFLFSNVTAGNMLLASHVLTGSALEVIDNRSVSISIDCGLE
jgi:hypothetical protein